MYRELLLEQIDRVEHGEEPIEVYRDASRNEIIELPVEKSKFGAHAWVRRGGTTRGLEQYMPLPTETADLFRQAQEREESHRPLLKDPASTLDPSAPPVARREVVLRRQ